MQAFTVTKRTVDGQDMSYQSLKISNGIWSLVEIKLISGSPSITLSFKSRVMEIAQCSDFVIFCTYIVRLFQTKPGPL